MKCYENTERRYLTRRLPTMIRLDGKAFHSFTKGFQKPFDMVLMQSMWDTAQYLCENIMGCKVAYTQSDEITLLLTDNESITTGAWFDKNLQKMVSVSASMATLAFNSSFKKNIDAMEYAKDLNIFGTYSKRINTALFDSRAFNISKEEVCNIFIWRQQDATRNAIQMVGRANFSPNELHKKSVNEIQEMLFQERQINFNDFQTYQKRGVCIIKETYMKGSTPRHRWVIDQDIPIFTQDRDYIERFLK